MNKKGRPNKYETNVKPRFDEIENWLKLGATEKEIAKRLGIHKGTLIEYKKMYSEFSNLIKKGRKQPVEEIKAAMLKRAKGFQYTEKKITTQFIELPEELIELLPSGEILDKEFKKPKLIRVEETIKTALPDVAAGLVLLQHWDKDEKGKTKWSRDPAQLELKKEELELKKEQADKDDW